MSADGAVAATSRGEGEPLRLYRLPGGEPISWPSAPQGEITLIALSPDGSAFLTGRDTGTLHVWEVATGRETGRLGGTDEETRAAAWPGATS